MDYEYVFQMYIYLTFTEKCLQKSKYYYQIITSNLIIYDLNTLFLDRIFLQCKVFLFSRRDRVDEPDPWRFLHRHRPRQHFDRQRTASVQPRTRHRTMSW